MTVCIAASCESGEKVVIAADRMFTAGPPLNLEFEPPLSKLEKMTAACMALAAGNSLFASEILSRVRAILCTQPDTSPLHVAHVAQQAFVKFRNEKIEEQILGLNLGPDFALFRDRGLSLPQYLQTQPGIYQNLVIQMNQFNLGVDLMLAGCDDSGGHIYHLSHPGTVTVFDKLGYNAIGSGGIHAMVALHLGKQNSKASLSATLHSVYSAKIAAEVAPGVGQETEIAVISKQQIWMCPDEFIAGMGKLRDESIQERKPDYEKIGKLYEEHHHTA